VWRINAGIGAPNRKQKKRWEISANSLSLRGETLWRRNKKIPAKTRRANNSKSCLVIEQETGDLNCREKAQNAQKLSRCSTSFIDFISRGWRGSRLLILRRNKFRAPSDAHVPQNTSAPDLMPFIQKFNRSAKDLLLIAVVMQCLEGWANFPSSEGGTFARLSGMERIGRLVR
jgi:hypothetical protein